MFDFKDNLGACISITYRRMVAALAKKLSVHGIGAGQYSYLFALFAEDGQTQQSLADLLMVDKAAAMRALCKLERLGLVRRIPDSRDKRAYRVRLTKKAAALRPKLEEAVLEILACLQDGMDDEERAEARRIAAKMADNMLKANRQD